MHAPATDDRPANPYRFAGSPDLSWLAPTAEGEAWTSFRRRLTPRFHRVWRDIGLNYAMLAVGVLIQLGLASQLTGWQWLLAPLTGIWLGFWVLALVSFFHEAAHFNIYADKRINDNLANWLIGGWIAQDVGHYRKVHWAHHLHLGSPEDTEVSYHNAPTLGFLLQTLCGIHLLRVFLRYRHVEPVEAKHPPSRSALLRAAALHGGILTALAVTGFYSVCMAWCLGMGLFFPFFATLRQILEHRDANARLGVDYRHEPHGAHNRLFGTDFLSRSFGSAGFNRHLLHHWDPTISYTRFDDMDQFLRQTALAPRMEDARTGYFQALQQVMHPQAAGSSAAEAVAAESASCPVCRPFLFCVSLSGPRFANVSTATR